MSADPALCQVPAPTKVMARNKPGYLGGKEVHAAVRAIVDKLVCRCCNRPPTAKEVLAQLPSHLKRTPRRINTHIREVMRERAIE